jgi:predicted branched-subunit amino acid permease
MNDPAAQTPANLSTRRYWFLRGVRSAASVPGLILVSAFVGFAGLAREAGVPLEQAVFMTGIVWALPAKVVLLGAIMAGNSLFAAAFAVALSSVRLTPMVVALMPELRTEKGRPWVLYLLSHFVAVTSWVIAMEKVREVPREMRTLWYGGLGGTLVGANMLVVALVYAVAGSLPPSLSAGLLLLTPIYFLTSLWGSARESASHFAMIFGMVLGPLFHIVMPGFDLMAAGFIGGGAAYFIHRLRKGQGAV